MSVRILIVDDEKLIRWSLFERLSADGYDVVSAADCATARNFLERESFDVAMLDLNLPDGKGMDLLKLVQERQMDTSVIIMTAFSTVDSAVDAMKLGAEDYVSKPFNLDELAICIKRTVENRCLRARVSTQVAREKERFGLQNIIGNSEGIAKVKATAKRVATSSSTTILLLGESGTGKDLLARAIHFESERAENAFINVSCTALPETLLESEIFGHERGAFTDAHSLKRGLFELADHGTVYLDEVGDMSSSLQAKLLRFLEEKSFRRIGGARDMAVDTRIIAATNRNLDEAIATGEFRQDLYYRLNAVPILLPPLRDRRADIPALTRHFLETYSREFRRENVTISDGALEKLMDHRWPGNIRELRNSIERAVLLSTRQQLMPEDFVLLKPGPHSPASAQNAFILPEEGCILEDVERRLVIQALERTDGNQTQAAELLGISRDQIRYKIQKFQLAAER